MTTNHAVRVDVDCLGVATGFTGAGAATGRETAAAGAEVTATAAFFTTRFAGAFLATFFFATAFFATAFLAVFLTADFFAVFLATAFLATAFFAVEAPTKFVALKSADGLKLRWVAPTAVEGLTGYNGEIRANGAGEWTVIATVPADQLTHQHRALNHRRSQAIPLLHRCSGL